MNASRPISNNPSSLIVSDFCHVVVGGNDVTSMRLPPVAEKHVEIKFDGPTAVFWVDTDDACGIAFDGHKEHLPVTRGGRDSRQASQAGFGAAG